MFSKFESDKLLPHCTCDHKIILNNDAKLDELLGYSGLQKMSLKEMETY